MQNSDIWTHYRTAKTLELREAIFSPEMIWEDVPQCRYSKSERGFTVPCILHIDAAEDQVTMPPWVPTRIHMQHDIIKQKIKHVWIKN
jgi:hypothetical protein